ncbi:hypothetical protein GALL_148760 [mine drainage metagenome]|uniref:Uncharacterized protein n=1 Tax=mine drainage metagenome TaxID=410659 RepID=A0A1J5S4U5_9ZZZZ
MIQQTVRLMDVFSPPENRWLMELSQRKTIPPVGVRIVRFNNDDGDGDVFEGGEGEGTKAKRLKKPAAPG